MKKTKFTESQIIGILKEQDQGKKVADICREHGISGATFYNWKSKYAGMSVDELKRQTTFRRENLSLADCSSAEPASISVQQSKFQISKLYLQPVEIHSHFQNQFKAVENSPR